MENNQKNSGLLAASVVILLGLVAFLTYRQTALDTKLTQTINQHQSSLATIKQVVDDLTALKSDVANQKTSVVDVNEKLGKIREDISLQLAETFVNKPQVALAQTLFSQNAVDESTYLITTDAEAFKKWLQANDVFIDYILTKSIALEFDRGLNAYTITEVVKNSLFDQLGFQEGDSLLAIDGVTAFASAADLRRRFVEMLPLQVSLMRNNKRRVLNILYSHPELKAEISRKDFDSSLPQLTGTARFSPVVRDGKVYGVKIVSIEEKSPLAAFKFQNEDIIQKINGKDVTLGNLVETLKSSAGNLFFDFERAGKSEQVLVTFATAENQ